MILGKLEKYKTSSVKQLALLPYYKLFLFISGIPNYNKLELQFLIESGVKNSIESNPNKESQNLVLGIKG